MMINYCKFNQKFNKFRNKIVIYNKIIKNFYNKNNNLKFKTKINYNRYKFYKNIINNFKKKINKI